MGQGQYRIEVVESGYRRVLLSFFLFLSWCAIYLWQPEVLPYQSSIQLLLSIVAGLYLLPKMRRRKPFVCQFNERGEVVFLEPSEATTWRISAESRTSFFWHWLVLTDPLTGRKKPLVLFKDSVSDTAWRHMSRIVHHRRGVGCEH